MSKLFAFMGGARFQVIAIVPAVGPTAGGTSVVIEVSDSSGAESAFLGARPLKSFAIVDPTHVSGVTRSEVVVLPNVVACVPSSGDIAGGTPVVVEVDDSYGITEVWFGGSSLYALDSLAIVDPTHVSGVTREHVVGVVPIYAFNGGASGGTPGMFTYSSAVLAAQFDGLFTLAVNSTHLWTGSYQGNAFTDGTYLQKLDTSVASPAVVATVDISAYSEAYGGGTETYVNRIRSYGGHVFACVEGVNNVAGGDTAHYNGFCLIVDDATNAIVGHVKLQNAGGSTDAGQASARAVCFDGAGNFYVAQSRSVNFSWTPSTSYVRKYSIADVIAAYPGFGTPIASWPLTHEMVNDIEFGDGAVWCCGGVESLHFSTGASISYITRFNATTGAETLFAFNTTPTGAGWFAECLVYDFGSLWASAQSGSYGPNPILRFNPATFPSTPTKPALGISTGGGSFGQPLVSDGTYLWLYAYNVAYRISTSAGSEAVAATLQITQGTSAADMAWDATAGKLWIIERQSRLDRVDAAVGAEVMDYALVTGGTTHVPILSSRLPISGSTAGGTSVVLTGKKLTATTSVRFGLVEAASFVVDSDTQITAVSPAHAAGYTNITAYTPTGKRSIENRYFEFT